MRLQRAPHPIRPRAIGQYAVYPTYSTSLGCNCGSGLGNEPPPGQAAKCPPGYLAENGECVADPATVAEMRTLGIQFWAAVFLGLGVGAYLGGRK